MKIFEFVVMVIGPDCRRGLSTRFGTGGTASYLNLFCVNLFYSSMAIDWTSVSLRTDSVLEVSIGI